VHGRIKTQWESVPQADKNDKEREGKREREKKEERRG
jgi:hypothetical protein